MVQLGSLGPWKSNDLKDAKGQYSRTLCSFSGSVWLHLELYFSIKPCKSSRPNKVPGPTWMIHGLQGFPTYYQRDKPFGRSLDFLGYDISYLFTYLFFLFLNWCKWVIRWLSTFLCSSENPSKPGRPAEAEVYFRRAQQGLARQLGAAMTDDRSQGAPRWAQLPTVDGWFRNPKGQPPALEVWHPVNNGRKWHETTNLILVMLANQQ